MVDETCALSVDVGVGDEVLEPLKVVTGEDWPGFGGVAPPFSRHFCEAAICVKKLHAYTLPRVEHKHPNQGPYRIGAFDERRKRSPKVKRLRRSVQRSENARATTCLSKLIANKSNYTVFDALATGCRSGDGAGKD